MPETLDITLQALAGSGTPPQWTFRVTHAGSAVCHCTGPRVLVLDALARWVALFTQASAPDA